MAEQILPTEPRAGVEICSTEYYSKKGEGDFFVNGGLRADQCAALEYVFRRDAEYEYRDPGFILSIGSGAGVLEGVLSHLGHEVVATDPFSGYAACSHNFPEAVRAWPDSNTILLCESLEHIPADQIEDAITFIGENMHGARLIIVNMLSKWPIGVNGWDHITPVDDELFDRIAKIGTVWKRDRAHLVVDVG